jgi:hypothetical protein
MRHRRPLTLMLLLAAAGPAAAQVYYGGYDLGPDYGSMLQQQLQRSDQLSAQMQAAEQQVVQQVMQNPQAIAYYQQHVASGGGLSFPQFAYQYAATAGFSRDGIARYRATERDNQNGERRAYAGYVGAQRDRAAAQIAYSEGYLHDQREAGNVLQGNSSWVDPATGQDRALAYTGNNLSVDPSTGQTFYRDGSGQYHALGSDGLWYPMNPAQ